MCLTPQVSVCVCIHVCHCHCHCASVCACTGTSVCVRERGWTFGDSTIICPVIKCPLSVSACRTQCSVTLNSTHHNLLIRLKSMHSPMPHNKQNSRSDVTLVLVSLASVARSRKHDTFQQLDDVRLISHYQISISMIMQYIMERSRNKNWLVCCQEDWWRARQNGPGKSFRMINNTVLQW